MNRLIRKASPWLRVLLAIAALMAIMIVALAHDEWPATPNPNPSPTASSTTTFDNQDGDSQGP